MTYKSNWRGLNDDIFKEIYNKYDHSVDSYRCSIMLCRTRRN